VGVSLAVIGSITWPLLFSYSGFASDWSHHLWLVWHQSLSIQQDHFPSFFLNSSYSVLNPIFAFYGGTLYALTGLLSLALGGAPVQAYVFMYMVGFVGAFGGWYWMARMAGLPRWAALVPGVVFVTSSYFVMLVYVRGDWPEFMGVSMISPMVASGISVLRGERLPVGATAALALSAVLFFGSHTITVLLGLTTLAVTVLAIFVCVPDARRLLTRRGAFRVTGVLVPAVMVSAWYLTPTLAYESRTRVGSEYEHARMAVKTTMGLVSMAHLFTLSRSSALSTPSPYPFALALPTVAIAWVLVGLVVLTRGRGDRTWARVLVICSALAVLVTLVMTHSGLLLALPRQYTYIQFSYRLESYVLLELSAAILAALVLARSGAGRRRRAFAWLALPVSVVCLIGAVGQVLGYPYPGLDRYETLEFYGQVNTGPNRDYADASEPVIASANLPTLEFPPAAVHDDRVSASVRVRPGTLLATNVAAGPYLVHVAGAKAVGTASETGYMVLAVGSARATAQRAGAKLASSGSDPVDTISIGPSDGAPIVIGRVLSVVGLVVMALGLVALVLLWLRRARAR